MTNYNNYNNYCTATKKNWISIFYDSNKYLVYAFRYFDLAILVNVVKFHFKLNNKIPTNTPSEILMKTPEMEDYLKNFSGIIIEFKKLPHIEETIFL